MNGSQVLTYVKAKKEPGGDLELIIKDSASLKPHIIRVRDALWEDFNKCDENKLCILAALRIKNWKIAGIPIGRKELMDALWRQFDEYTKEKKEQTYVALKIKDTNISIHARADRKRLDALYGLYREYLREQIQILDQKAGRADRVRKREENGQFNDTEIVKKCSDVKKLLEQYGRQLQYREAAGRAERLYYERKKQQEEMEEVLAYYNYFEKLMRYLAFFAGCTDHAQWCELSGSFQNERAMIQRILEQDQLVQMHKIEIRPFMIPETAKEQDGMDSSVRRKMEAAGEQDGMDSSARREINAYRKKLEELSDKLSQQNGMSSDEYKNWEQQLSSIQKKICERLSEWKKERGAAGYDEYLKGLQRKKDIFLSETQKMADSMRHKKKRWNYLMLLCMALPILDRIHEQMQMDDEEFTEEFCMEIGREVRRLIEDFDYRSYEMALEWVMPGSQRCRESEEIQIDFLPWDAKWPGLYGSDQPGGALYCIRPGGDYENYVRDEKMGSIG